MSEQTQYAQNQITQLIQRATQDEAFRQALLQNPQATLAQALGAAPEEAVTAKIVGLLTGELSEAELDDVSGGIIAILIGRKPGEDSQIGDGTSNTRLPRTTGSSSGSYIEQDNL